MYHNRLNNTKEVTFSSTFNSCSNQYSQSNDVYVYATLKRTFCKYVLFTFGMSSIFWCQCFWMQYCEVIKTHFKKSGCCNLFCRVALCQDVTEHASGHSSSMAILCVFNIHCTAAAFSGPGISILHQDLIAPTIQNRIDSLMVFMGFLMIKDVACYKNKGSWEHRQMYLTFGERFLEKVTSLVMPD